MKSKILGLLVVGLLAGPMVAGAAVLIVADGRLLGATGVTVGHRIYDVQFVDGVSCVQLFDGCDSSSEFAFQNPAAAGRASRALLDQVFLDGPQGMFDSLPEPNLIEGCPGYGQCLAVTPWGPGPGYVRTVIAANYYSFTGGDRYYGKYYSPNNNLDGEWETWANWSLVGSIPEPGTLALLGLGLGLGFGGLSFMRRRSGKPGS